MIRGVSRGFFYPYHNQTKPSDPCRFSSLDKYLPAVLDDDTTVIVAYGLALQVVAPCRFVAISNYLVDIR